MKNELYHSDIYLGLDYSDGIKHYKYIKREKRNGRWVYYYNTSELEKQRDITKEGIQFEKNIIENGYTYIGPNGQKFGPDHYKKAIKYDYVDLAKTNAKIQSIKYATKGLNIVSKILDNTKKINNKLVKAGKNKVDKIINKIKSKTKIH